MWKLELPYRPGDTVYTPTCSHMGSWGIEKCTVSHYLIRGETDIEISMRQEKNHSFRFCKLNEVFSTPEAAKAYAEAKQKEWETKKQ